MESLWGRWPQGNTGKRLLAASADCIDSRESEGGQEDGPNCVNHQRTGLIFAQHPDATALDLQSQEAG